MHTINVKHIEIKPAHIDDARKLKTLGDTLLTETDFFHRLPHERARSVEDMIKLIQQIDTIPRCLYLVLWNKDKAIGEGILTGGHLERLHHSGTVGLGVLQDFCGYGLGRKLMEAFHKTAKEWSISRLELTVLVQNTPAIAFYEKLGYMTEGRKRGSVRINGIFMDEFIMAKHL